MPEDKLKNPPKTVSELGIHMMYMNQTMTDIKRELEKTPSRVEFDTLKTAVETNKQETDGKITRKEVGIIATVITFVLGFISFIFNYIRG